MHEEQRFEDLRRRWEQRAQTYRSVPTGVLYQGLSPALNDHVHRFHLNGVLEKLLPGLPRGGRLLDLGCGYGRIGDAIRAGRPDLEIVGCDIAPTYCRLYRDRLGVPVACGDLARLPFRAGSFDGVLSVTALMYLPPPLRPAAIAALLGLVRADGVALLIEPAQEALALATCLRPRAARQTTGGSGFSEAELERIGRAAGCAAVASGGMPAFTLALPLLILLDRWPAMQARLLRLAANLDCRLSAWNRYSLHRWLLLRCPGSGHG